MQKSFHLSHPNKIELKKISSPSENKKYATTQPDTTKTLKLNDGNGFQTRWVERQLVTACCLNWRCSASYDSFVGKETFLLRMNFSSENRQLRQHAKR
jgi:hypothetical protein